MKNQIQNEPKLIDKIPIQELWAGKRLVSTIKVRQLNADTIINLLQAEEVRFAVADVGKELWWIPNNERFDFWKDEVKTHLATWERTNEVAAFPDSYFYLASEWQSYNGKTIILLEKYH